MISTRSIQQIEQQTEIVDVLSHFISLKRRGVNYIGLCPFHGEKTPSFTVSPSKQIYKCFGCGKSGSTITFLMEHEKLSYPESLRWLADKYHIELEETEASQERKKEKEKSNSLAIVNKFASDFFHHALYHTQEGQRLGLSYLKERGFTDESIQLFQLGFSPGSREDGLFYKAARVQQFDEEILLHAGLVRERNGIKEDSYAGRMIFPIYLPNQKVCGFAARKLGEQDSKSPKYINTAQNELYNKSETLYGLHLAKEHILKHSCAILVEGYTDVISLVQHGIKNVVASGGTALTQEQILQLKKLTPEITLFYDTDSAGINATIKAINHIIPFGIYVTILQAPSGEDPDSFAKSRTDRELMDYVVQTKKSFIDFLMSSLITPESGVEEKSEAINKIAEVLSHFYKIEDQIKRQAYIKQVASALDIETESLNRLVNIYIKKQLQKTPTPSTPFSPTSSPASMGEVAVPASEQSPLAQPTFLRNVKEDTYAHLNLLELLRLLMTYGEQAWDENQNVATYIFSYLEDMHLYDTIHEMPIKKMLQEYETHFRKEHYLGVSHFLYHADEQFRTLAVELNKEVEKPNYAWKTLIADYAQEENENYIKAIQSMLALLAIRNIKKLMYMNQTERFAQSNPSSTDQESIKLETHKFLMDWQKQVAQTVGIAIVP